MRRWTTALAGTSVLAATVMGTGHHATARPAPTREEHCVLMVTDRGPDGRLKTKPMVCDTTQAAARSAAGVSAETAADWAIGVHYDGPGFTGSSVTVVGADCAGGWLNLPSSWNDRISSTRNGCGAIRHFVHANLTGGQQTTLLPGGNLVSPVNNEVSSIQYLT